MDSLKEVIESILFVAGEAVEFNDISDKLDISLSEIKKAVKELKDEKEKSFSGVQVQIFNNKAQLCSNPNYTEKVSEVLNPIKERALTRAVLEVAAICAYKQPLTRLEVEHVRGVNSDYAINVLIENSLIEVIGRKDAIGKPLLYGTTDAFLKRFNIESIDVLPDYQDLLDRIEIIKAPESSLFNFNDIPDSEKEPSDFQEQTEERLKEIETRRLERIKEKPISIEVIDQEMQVVDLADDDLNLDELDRVFNKLSSVPVDGNEKEVELEIDEFDADLKVLLDKDILLNDEEINEF